VSGPTYGSSNAPTDPGSSGCGNSASQSVGGSGGGLLRLKATGNVRVDGTIKMNGRTSNYTGNTEGSGSGGGIYIACKSINGIGTIQASGASGTIANGGDSGAGGGRIAVWYKVSGSNYSGTCMATGGGPGGAGAGTGAVGTVLWLLDAAPQGTMIMFR
jgi:hypothetical protein